MSAFPVDIGDSVRVTKTVGESDVYLFAGITGDLSPVHVDEEHMRGSPYGGRIAHGALVLGLTSAASTRMVERSRPAPDEMAVSAGYDRIRFTRGVRLGDTLTVTYTVARIDETRRRAWSDIEVTNQKGEVVAIATHILQWVKER
jgi:3-hydroxybutyryl-CoA dehydratase